MGQEVIRALCQETDMLLVGGIAKGITQDLLPLPLGSGVIPLSEAVGEILDRTQPLVLVDFSVAEATMIAIPLAVRRMIHLVIGTTGLKDEDLSIIENLAKENGVGAIVSPNFALGAVMMIELAKKAAKYFDYAEIVEMHHHQKIDAPSGTAITTARSMIEARGKPFSQSPVEKETVKGTRGGEIGGIALHSLRLPGLMAHQEIILGARGQTLTLRHDTISRECYIPGILLAIREVVNKRGLIYGLEKLLGLE